MYEYSTKSDAEKHGYDGLARLIPAAEVAGLIRFHPPHPPNSRSILSLQTDDTDAEIYAELCAVPHSDYRADARAVHRAVLSAARTRQNASPFLPRPVSEKFLPFLLSYNA